MTTGSPLVSLRTRIVSMPLHRISDDFIPGGMLPPQGPRANPPLPHVTPVNLDQIKADAYALGRADERLDTRDHVERVTELALSRNAPPQVPAPLRQPPLPPAPAPPGLAFLQRRPSVRLVQAGDVAHRLEEETLDRLERFHLDDGRYERRYDDARYEPRYSDSAADAISRRQALEERMRREDELAEWEEEQILQERGEEAGLPAESMNPSPTLVYMKAVPTLSLLVPSGDELLFIRPSTTTVRMTDPD